MSPLLYFLLVAIAFLALLGVVLEEKLMSTKRKSRCFWGRFPG